MAEIPEEDLKLLKAAAESKDPKEVMEALRRAKKKNRREIGGYRFTAVQRAIYSNATIAHVLISDRGVKLNKEDTLGHTPLHLGWSGCVAAMLRTGRTDIEWDHADHIGQTPLLYHARLGNETSLTALLALGESAVSMSKTTTDGFTALHQVVEQDRRFFPSRHVFPSLDKRCDFVDILLTAKKDRAKTAKQLQNLSLEDVDLESDVRDQFVNTKDILGRSVLHYIAEEGCVEILDKLLDWFQVEEVKNSVDFNAADVHGCAPLLLAVQRRHTDMVRRLLKLPEGQITFDVGVTVSALHPSGLKKYEVKHKQLYRPNLFSKAPTEQYCGTNLTPLHVAVNVNRHFGVAAALLLDPLERTIKPMIDNERWEMFDKVLCLAEGPDDKTTAVKLFTKLVDSIKRPTYDDTDFGLGHVELLITVAAKMNRHKIIRHILKWKPEVNADFKSKWADNKPGLEATPLHFAVLGQHLDAVRALLTHLPLDTNVQDSNSQTPLQIATESRDDGMREIENLLLGRPELKEFVDRSYRDRQVFVDAANALLVGAALVASAAFASWLQPPRGYTPNESVVAVKGDPTLKVFVVFNTLSFFFAIATVLACTCATIPSFKHRFIGKVVKFVRNTLIVASILFSISIFCVLGAFATAGLAVLPINYDWSLLVGTIILGLLCIAWLGVFCFR